MWLVHKSTSHIISNVTRTDMIIDMLTAALHAHVCVVYLKTLALLWELLLLASPPPPPVLVLVEGMRMRCASCTSTLASER